MKPLLAGIVSSLVARSRRLVRPFPHFGWATPLPVLICCALPAFAQESTAVIDAGSYANDATAQAAWRPMAGTSPVAAVESDGKPALRFPCDFGNSRDVQRASWDRSLDLDLSGCRGVSFDFLCRDASPVSHFSLYFQSGAGWYAGTFHPESTGWNRITVETSDMSAEGQPAGWASIRTIRISAWRGSDDSTEFFLRDFRKVGVPGADTRVALIRCDSANRSGSGERPGTQRFLETVAEQFQALGIGYATLSDLDVTSAVLKPFRLVVLPHNPTMPEPTVSAIGHFLEDGGRLLTFYGMPASLREPAGIEAGPFLRPEEPGGFAAMRFAEDALPGAPALVKQNSWNIREPKAVSGASRVLAEWLDANGQPTGRAAVVASSNAIEMSHVLLDDDAANQRQMLLAMAGQLVPELWQQSAVAAIDQIGRLGGLDGFATAEAAIRQVAAPDSAALPLLEATRRLRLEAIAHQKAGRYPEACAHAKDAAAKMLEAFAAAQKPLPGEFRAFWCHSAFGVPGLSWDDAIARLADNGFTAILPNLLWGGVTFYPSRVLPVSPQVTTRGDQLAECLAACRKHGIKIHVWKVNWNLGSAPEFFVDRMRQENRLQASSGGNVEPWLCPSHPDNQKLEIDSLVEVVQHYPVDGIHFDYIRYPNGDHCFCTGCRDRFRESVGAESIHWPEDALRDGRYRREWLDWRRANITGVVRAVSEQARAVRPEVQLSAAVFRNWPFDRDSVGQDWKLWCDRGYLDFVCPMDYTTSDVQLRNWAVKQVEWAGNTPCYPGIGAWKLTPDRVIGQIKITRELNTGGFVLFNYTPSAAHELVPLLGRGITKELE
jgi:uncharacterized lipoprotein YddW (UPF0748 family)